MKTLKYDDDDDDIYDHHQWIYDMTGYIWYSASKKFKLSSSFLSPFKFFENIFFAAAVVVISSWLTKFVTHHHFLLFCFVIFGKRKKLIEINDDCRLRK